MELTEKDKNLMATMRDGEKSEYLRLREKGSSENMASILASQKAPGTSRRDERIKATQKRERNYNMSDSFHDTWRPESKGDIERKREEQKRKGKHFISREDLRDFSSEERRIKDDSDLKDIVKGL